MRQILRPTSAPAALADPALGRMRTAYSEFLQLDLRARAQTRQPDRHLPYLPELETALQEVFAGKCAFCETRARLVPYRFRPTSDAQPAAPNDDQAHLHYGWLADVWENLYLICSDCRPREANHFPVTGARCPPPDQLRYAAYARAGTGLWGDPIDETPVLLDPCLDHPGRHLAALPDGRLAPHNTRGLETIEHFGLNRPPLIAARLPVAEAALSGVEVPPEVEHSGFARLLVQARKARPVRQLRQLAARPSRKPPKVAAHWRLEKVSIRHFKAIEALEFTVPHAPASDLAQAALLLGENAAGKSSILEAIALTMASDESRTRIGLNPGTLLLNPRFLGDDSLPIRSEGHVSLRFSTPQGEVAERTLYMAPQHMTVEATGPELPPVFAYGAYRHYRTDYRRWTPERGIISLFRSDNLLSNPERWLISLPPQTFDAVVRALRSVFGVSFSHIEADRESGRCIVHTSTDGMPAQTPLSAVSSGFRTILALMCDAIRWLTTIPRRAPPGGRLDDARALILIDEVEAHLHPRWKLRIMEGLRRALPGATFIATTHDPLCLRGMRDGEVQVLRRRAVVMDESEMPTLVETLENLPDIAELTIDQLLTADFFGLFDTDDPRMARAIGRVTDLQLSSGPTGGMAMSDLLDALQADSAGQPANAAVMVRFRSEVRAHLPVGRTEVARLVEDAVADYLRLRAASLPSQAAALRSRTRQRIVELLRGT